MCICTEQLEYEPRRGTRAVPIIEKSYDRHVHPHYASTGRPKRSLHIPDIDSYTRDNGYGTLRPALRRSKTPPPVLIQSTPMGRVEGPLRSATGGRFGRGGAGGGSPGIRSGEMGFNQPMVLQDGLGPVIHQGHSAHYQTSHHTGHPPHIHTSGPRSATPRRYSVHSSNDRERASGSRYIGYRDGSGSSSSLSDDSYGSERRLFTHDVRGSYGARRSGEKFYHSPSTRRLS